MRSSHFMQWEETSSRPRSLRRQPAAAAACRRCHLSAASAGMLRLPAVGSQQLLSSRKLQHSPLYPAAAVGRRLAAAGSVRVQAAAAVRGRRPWSAVGGGSGRRPAAAAGRRLPAASSGRLQTAAAVGGW